MSTHTKNRSLVAITGPARRMKYGYWAAKIQLAKVGLSAIYVSANNPDIPRDVCGVIIGGGDDIDPKHYGVTGTAGANYDAERDTMEMNVIQYAMEHDMPMLGICRGSQLINVVHGGNLHTDIRPLRKLTPNRNSAFPIKQADLIEGSRLMSIFQRKCLSINSLHSQAVDRVGDGLRAAAHDKDGFIQAIENPNKPFLIGVQWHPEYLLFKSVQTRLFRAFAEQVRACAETKD